MFPSSAAKADLENLADNTYGIEVEFATHDNQPLSFTHIEVCYIYQNGTDPEKGWKIETDADYTLELVSPILYFPSELRAREFKQFLLDYLEKAVHDGVLLSRLVADLVQMLPRNFKLDDSGHWVPLPNAQQSNLDLRVDWINAPTLYNKLDWFNWDEDTSLEQVLTAKRILNSADGPNFWNNALEATMLTSSKKHGGLPSSQMNLPLELAGYVTYQVDHKRQKAWIRLFEDETSDPLYKAKMRGKLAATYPDLAGTPGGDATWKAKYMNDDYLDEVIDGKVPIWHRYWLWLETYYQATCMISSGNPKEQLQIYKAKVDAITIPAAFETLDQVKDAMKKLYDSSPTTITRKFALSYLTVEKLVAGTMACMSETYQKEAQQLVMHMDADMSMEDIMDSFPNRAFMHFHYALKDLTSLWFKCPLVQVFENEDTGNEVANWMKVVWDEEPITMVIANLLEINLQLLGWYYGVAAACNQGFDYDWEEFLAYNMPTTFAFENQLRKGVVDWLNFLNGAVNAPPLIYSTAQMDMNDVVFLQREYGGHVIAPWEGRWDTMKGPIIIDKQPARYLVEHRNN